MDGRQSSVGRKGNWPHSIRCDRPVHAYSLRIVHKNQNSFFLKSGNKGNGYKNNTTVTKSHRLSSRYIIALMSTFVVAFALHINCITGRSAALLWWRPRTLCMWYSIVMEKESIWVGCNLKGALWRSKSMCPIRKLKSTFCTTSTVTTLLKGVSLDSSWLLPAVINDDTDQSSNG